MKNWYFNKKILESHIFFLKYTEYNTYVVKSSTIFIRKLLSIRIEKEKCAKTLKHANNMFFDQKMHFFTQISERSTCTHLHHLDLDSGGQRYLEMTKKFPAYAKTTCWWNSPRLFLKLSIMYIRPNSKDFEGHPFSRPF